MRARALCKSGVVSVVLAGFVFAAPAFASSGGTTHSLAGHFVSASASDWVQDGTCPVKPLDGDPSEGYFEEYHQTYVGQVAQHPGESVHVSVCWQNSSAMGGDGVDSGRFTVATSSGTVSGNVSGGIDNAHHSVDFTLAIRHSSGDLDGTTGSLTVLGCPAHRGFVGSLRARSGNYPPACT